MRAVRFLLSVSVRIVSVHDPAICPNAVLWRSEKAGKRPAYPLILAF